ncbi:sulfotransferase domain-containing protein [Neptunicella sp. SCSIO 80796]|uniref:sulfotransferase domain-containing protein n=1 Tax=Neptunicella plasticusilytica TaxID=3117012 RepID=UPI003A4D6512
MSSDIKLITGIPRSGTTLCCKLLNQRNDTVALHEPINPATVPDSFGPAQAVTEIQQQIKKFDTAIQHGLPFAHGDQGGLDIDNPVGNEQQHGIRKVVAKRGEIQLAPRASGSYQLIVKQNALFTALLPLLSLHYPMLCIVRNPVDVLLSWMTVDLPVNRGHIPAGERFSPELCENLKNKNCLQRQLEIYQWFINQFSQSSLPIVRYEDVLKSDGSLLDNAIGLAEIQRDSLTAKKRQFELSIVDRVESVLPQLFAIDYADLYSVADIQSALDKVVEKGSLFSQE